MSSAENLPLPEREPNENPYSELLDEGTYLINQAFEEMKAGASGRGMAKFITLDTDSFENEALYSALISKTGVRAETGVEMIYVKAFPKDSTKSLDEIMDAIYGEDEDLPIRTERLYIQHYMPDGTVRNSWVDENGIHPWLLHGDVLETDEITDIHEVEMIDFSILDLFATDSLQPEEDQSLSDMMYAFDLTYKFSSAEWHIMPQN